jgi:hypothetical protein
MSKRIGDSMSDDDFAISSEAREQLDSTIDLWRASLLDLAARQSAARGGDGVSSFDMRMAAEELGLAYHARQGIAHAMRRKRLLRTVIVATATLPLVVLLAWQLSDFKSLDFAVQLVAVIVSMVAGLATMGLSLVSYRESRLAETAARAMASATEEALYLRAWNDYEKLIRSIVEVSDIAETRRLTFGPLFARYSEIAALGKGDRDVVARLLSLRNTIAHSSAGDVDPRYIEELLPLLRIEIDRAQSHSRDSN